MSVSKWAYGGVGAAAAAVIAWFATQGDPKDPMSEKPGDTAVVEQPSGKVLPDGPNSGDAKTADAEDAKPAKTTDSSDNDREGETRTPSDPSTPATGTQPSDKAATAPSTTTAAAPATGETPEDSGTGGTSEGNVGTDASATSPKPAADKTAVSGEAKVDPTDKAEAGSDPRRVGGDPKETTTDDNSAEKPAVAKSDDEGSATAGPDGDPDTTATRGTRTEDQAGEKRPAAPDNENGDVATNAHGADPNEAATAAGTRDDNALDGSTSGATVGAENRNAGSGSADDRRNTAEKPSEDAASVGSTGEKLAAADPTGDPTAGAKDRQPDDAPRTDEPRAPEAGTNGQSVGAPARDDAAADQDPNAPRFDLVRIDPNGQAVLAGRAQPNQRVEIMLDGKVLDSVVADASGAFVAIVETPLTGEAQNLQLRVPAPPTDDKVAKVPTERVGNGAKEGDLSAATPGTSTGDATRTDTAAAPTEKDESPTSTGDPAPDPTGDAPRISSTALALSGPLTETDDGIETGKTGGGVARAGETGALAAPGRPTSPGGGSEDRTAPDRATAPSAPGRLAAVPKADDAVRRSGADTPVTGARTVDPASNAPDQSVPEDKTDTVAVPPAPEDLAVAPAPDDNLSTGDADRPIDSTRADPDLPAAAASGDGAPETPGSVADTRFLTSAPVIILPASDADDAPTLLKPTRADLKILQPSVSDINSVVLDRISYGETGDVVLTGRGRAGRAVRVYGNGLIIGTTRIASDGTWSLSVDETRGQQIKLLRLDELDTEGKVATRIEAPFTYSRSEPKLVRQREVQIQRGDVLWRIAEQYYGEGLRYSVIYGANDKLIRDPDLIYPGQIFTVPELVDAEPER